MKYSGKQLLHLTLNLTEPESWLLS